MTIEQSLTTFTLAATVMTMTPGLDTALVLRVSMAEGAKAAIGAGAGILLGILLWGGVVAVGLGGLLAASAVAYTGLRWIGAAYLCYLGLKLVLRPRQGFGDLPANEAREAAPRSWFAKGLLTNLLNPKVGVFYVTFLPQFVPGGVAVAPWTFLLAAIHAALGVVWFALLISASAPLGRTLQNARVVRTLDRLTGGVFLAFGAKLALSRG